MGEVRREWFIKNISLPCNVHDLCPGPHCFRVQPSRRVGSIKAFSRITAEIRGRLPEYIKSDVKRMEEYPKKMNQPSVGRRNAKTNPVRNSSWDDHSFIASLIMIVPTVCLIHL